jgi:hypothetical protein
MLLKMNNNYKYEKDLLKNAINIIKKPYYDRKQSEIN